jgi:hypothetical protein
MIQNGLPRDTPTTRNGGNLARSAPARTPMGSLPLSPSASLEMPMGLDRPLQAARYHPPHRWRLRARPRGICRLSGLGTPRPVCAARPTGQRPRFAGRNLAGVPMKSHRANLGRRSTVSTSSRISALATSKPRSSTASASARAGDWLVSAARRSELASTTTSGTPLPLPRGQLVLDVFRG